MIENSAAKIKPPIFKNPFAAWAALVFLTILTGVSIWFATLPLEMSGKIKFGSPGLFHVLELLPFVEWLVATPLLWVVYKNLGNEILANSYARKAIKTALIVWLLYFCRFLFMITVIAILFATGGSVPV